MLSKHVCVIIIRIKINKYDVTIVWLALQYIMLK